VASWRPASRCGPHRAEQDPAGFLVDAVCDAVIDPNDDRLDALAAQLRAGAAAEVSEVEGPCVRVRTLAVLPDLG
jgi:hypothetical protein